MNNENSNQGASGDLLHKLAIVAVAAYAWQLHGWFIGLIALIATIVLIVATNLAIMANASEKNMFRLLRTSRWGWVVVVGMIFVFSGASVSEASP